MFEEEPRAPLDLDLSITLRPEERAMLAAAGADPKGFVALDVPVAKLAPGELGRGVLELRAQVLVSDTLFAATDPAKRRLFLANGKIEAPNLKLGLAPTLRLVVALEAIGDKAREEMEQSIVLQRTAEGSPRVE